MAMALTPSKIVVTMLLNNGTTATGGVKTVGIRLGGSQSINLTAYSANLATSRQKAYNIISAIVPALSKTLVDVTEATTGSLTVED